MTVCSHSLALRLFILLPGVWLFARRAFQVFLPSFDSDATLNGIALALCVSYLVLRSLLVASSFLRRAVPALLSLVIGFFSLVLSAHSPERVLWIETVRLLASRASPFIGLLTILAAWRPRRGIEVLLFPLRWWMALPRTAYTICASILAFAGPFLMAAFGYTCMPRSYDGVANVFQARIFASGHLTIPPPPHPSAFLHFGLIQDPAWCSYYPPAYSAVLSIGLLLGSACVVNPILTAMTVPALERIAFRLYGRATAALTVLLFAFSPFVPIVGGSFRDHTLALLLLSWATALLLDPTGRKRSIVISGLIAGAAVLTRPYTAFLWFCGLSLGFALDRPRRLLKTLWPFALGAIPGLIVAVLYTLVQTGGDLVPPPVYLYGEEFGLGFGPRVMGSHTLLRALSFTTTRIEGIGRMVLGWPFPIVLLPLALIIMERRRSNAGVHIWTMALPPTFLLLGYSLFWFLEFSHGPRYVYSALITLVPWMAHAMLHLPIRIESILPQNQKRSVRPMLTGAVTLSILYALLVTWPRKIQVYVDHYGCEVDLPDLVQTLPPGEKLIFFSPVTPTISDYGWGFLMNSLELDGEFVVAFDGGAEQNEEVIALFPNRQVYHYSYDLKSRQGFLRRRRADTAPTGSVS